MRDLWPVYRLWADQRCTWSELEAMSITDVLIANEMLDAFYEAQQAEMKRGGK
jgi:hypothetical protein